MASTWESFAQVHEQAFKGIQISQATFEQVEFVGCRFLQASLTEVIFEKCRFVDCRFEQSDLSLCSFPGTNFSGCEFRNTKLVGIDWTLAAWAGLMLHEPLMFDECVLSHSTFIGMKLKQVRMTNCIATDVDFREADLAGANFSGTELSQSIFQQTPALTDYDAISDAMESATEKVINGAPLEAFADLVAARNVSFLIELGEGLLREQPQFALRAYWLAAMIKHEDGP